jgi:hypothetical protein
MGGWHVKPIARIGAHFFMVADKLIAIRTKLFRMVFAGFQARVEFAARELVSLVPVMFYLYCFHTSASH